ncbi:MAG TPA: hypothetical protein VFT49_03025 [Candidatus Saccharimonadales bacterium]|nr:hypothetical protein [Candidatus Saccharimonadales bacterium]
MGISREKSSTDPAIAGFGFIPKGALRKTGVPAKFTLWGDGTVGCPQKPEAQ